jgi:hypothetical protein
MNMKRVSLIAILATVVLLVQAQLSLAQVTADKSFDGWTLLGTRTVDYTLDRDIIAFKESGENFQTLKFIVKNGTLNMHKCSVHFADGDTKVIELTDEMNKSNDGRILDLKGSNKKIEKVTFWYDSKNNSNDKSVVELWGKR